MSNKIILLLDPHVLFVSHPHILLSTWIFYLPYFTYTFLLWHWQKYSV